MFDLNNRRQFVAVAAVFEGGLALVGIALALATGVDLQAHVAWEWKAVGWGVAGAVPMFALFVLSYRFASGSLQRIKQLLIEMLGRPLAACRWYDLVLVALLAGVGEELLFRGWLQVWLERKYGAMAGLAVSNLVFGLVHCITPVYALLAGLLGVYLGVLFDAGGERNLIVPIITHALYDYLAFLVVARTWRRGGAPVERASDF